MSDLNELEVIPMLRKPCDKCVYARIVNANGGWSFIGCYCDPYHGKWCKEIEICPNNGADTRGEADDECISQNC